MKECLFFFLFFLLYSLSAQKHPLSKSDSGVVFQNLERYERLLENDDYRGASGALNEVAFVFWNNNHYQEAINYYEKSLVLNYKVANENGQAMLNNNLGMLYADLGDYDKSLDHFTKTLASRRSNKEPVGIISALINMSVVLNNLQRYDESVKNLLEALDIARELYDVYQMRSTYGMLSETYEKMGDVERSLQYFDLYKSFHEEIQRKEMKGIQKELNEERVQKQLVEAESNKKELELLRQELELIKKEEVIHEQDSINQSLFVNLTRKEIEIKLLEQQSQINAFEAEARKVQNQKLLQEKVYLRNTLIMVMVSVLIIGYLIFLNMKKARVHNKELMQKNASIEAQRKELEEANEVKNKIFSIISHDLRSPISSLQSFFYILDDLELSDNFKSALRGVESQLASSATLLDNLLTWSKSQIQKASPSMMRVDLRQLVESSMRLLQVKALEKEIKLINEVEEGFELRTDEDMINIVIRNLVQNAIKFTRKGGSVLVRMVENDGLVKLSIEDTGVGMTRDKLESLFDISTNRSSIGTNEEKGTGLGLILCKELIEKLNGYIEVSSEPDVGSVFTLSFYTYHNTNTVTE